MRNAQFGKFIRRMTVLASTTLLARCAPSSISAPPPMRHVPDGPALAGRRIGLLDLGRVTPASTVTVATGAAVRAASASA